MKKYDTTYTFVETQEQLLRFANDIKRGRWIAFDTEFIPEKYYRYKLCVISVAAERGNYILDVIKLDNIDAFLKIVENPKVLKITHAGENDYRILLENYGTKAVNVFDTQLSHGFLQFDYPLGLQSMVKKVMRKRIDKGQLRSDWEKRPLSKEQCLYAIGDVIYLHPLKLKIKKKLEKNGKLEWALQENRRLEEADFYESDPLDFLSSGQVQQMTRQQQAFLLRMHMWRHLEAEKENRPVTMIMKTWVLNTIVQKIASDESALLKDRTLPARFLRKNLDTFKKLHKKKVSPHEQELIDRIPEASTISPRNELLTDMLHQLIKYKGLERKVSPKLIIPGKEVQRMKADKEYFPPSLSGGWREDMLGRNLVKLIKNRKDFDIIIKKDKYTLRMKDENRFSLKRFFLRKDDDDDYPG